MKPADAKLQRWIDLLAALLGHRYGVPLADLKTLVPAYGSATSRFALERMFERDKDELRALGLPIRVHHEDSEDGTIQRYYMKAKETYLPFLTLASRSTAPAPTRKPPGEGYREIPTIAFEPDELSALVGAARCATRVGNPALSRDVESAIAKLTYDLGLALGSAVGESDDHAARVAEPGAVPAVSVLGAAVLRRKLVTFVYRSMNRDATEERTVEPYGVYFSSGHWYLVGRDTGSEALRKFRVSRMAKVRANAKKPQSVDYDVPADFDLAAHARAKEPWELGENAPEEMVVEIHGDSGSAESVRTLGASVAGAPARRRFQVRRADSFVRWLMSFGGEVVPLSPPSLCEHYLSVVEATLHAYERNA